MVRGEDARKREGELFMMQYTASEKETFDDIAFNLYGDESYSYLLLQANPAHCHKIMLEGGEVLEAPELEQAENTTLPPWKRRA